MQQSTAKDEQTKRDAEMAFKRHLEPGAAGLTPSQARCALRCLGHNKSVLEVDKFWSDTEKPEGDTLSLEEFVQLYTSQDSEPDRLMSWAFNKFDSNMDGTIDIKELKEALTSVYGEDFVDDSFVKDVFKLADENGDGILQIEEFVTMLMERSKT